MRQFNKRHATDQMQFNEKFTENANTDTTSHVNILPSLFDDVDNLISVSVNIKVESPETTQQVIQQGTNFFSF